jgi:3-oxoacyl-[acyl-carrier protein] reductase
MSDNLKLSETPAALDGRDSLGEDGAHDGITRSSILVGMMRAIVTGATSGIGLACLQRLLAGGAEVVGMDVVPPNTGAGLYHHVTCDLADVNAVRTAIDTASERLGQIDGLFHFGARFSSTKWDVLDADEWDRVSHVTLRGAFFIAQAVAKKMLPHRSGTIILTASDSVNVGGMVAGPAYIASKGGIIAVTRLLARALGPSGIRVNAISPGVVETPMTASWDPAVKAAAVKQTPLGRLALPDDIARVAVMLAGETSSFITGEIVEVNGGSYFG